MSTSDELLARKELRDSITCRHDAIQSDTGACVFCGKKVSREGGRMKLPTELAEAILAREGPVNGQISALEAASIEAVVRDIAKFLHDNGGNGGILGIGTNTAFRLSAAILARYGLGE